MINLIKRQNHMKPRNKAGHTENCDLSCTFEVFFPLTALSNNLFYFNWTLLHLNFNQRNHSLINIGFLWSCLTSRITSTDVEGRRKCFKNCDENFCRLLIRNDHGDSGGFSNLSVFATIWKDNYGIVISIIWHS